MCGLVGIAGDINKAEKDAFKTLLVVDTLRGPHSTGVASIKFNGDWDLAKKKGNAWDLFDSREYSSLLNGATYALIGHNRYATKGKINNINAHPFEFADVVGAHNGTIRGQHRLPDHARFEVDSENIFYAIQEEGLEETLSKLDGAYALSYWDKRSEELVLLRNNERTLFYCFSDNLKTVFWASEMWMLYAALGRANIKFKQPKEVPETTIMRFKFERKINAGPVELTTQEFEEFVPPKTSYTRGNNYYGGQGSTKKTTPLLPKSSEASTSGDSEGKVKPGSIINKRVDFTVDGMSRNVYGQAYVSCSLWADPSCEVRVYAPEGSPLWRDLLDSVDETFSGVVSSYTNSSGEYVFNIKLSTVELVIEEDDENVPFEGGKKGECAWCSDLIDQDKGVVWVDGNTAVCSACQKVDEVKEYLEMAS